MIGFARRLARRTARGMPAPLRRERRRREARMSSTARMLSGLDDRTLLDLGLRRGEILAFVGGDALDQRMVGPAAGYPVSVGEPGAPEPFEEALEVRVVREEEGAAGR
jgi:hypothetical protein